MSHEHDDRLSFPKYHNGGLLIVVKRKHVEQRKGRQSVTLWQPTTGRSSGFTSHRGERLELNPLVYNSVVVPYPVKNIKESVVYFQALGTVTMD